MKVSGGLPVMSERGLETITWSPIGGAIKISWRFDTLPSQTVAPLSLGILAIHAHLNQPANSLLDSSWCCFRQSISMAGI
jgi:hypothetical protein